MLKLWFRSLPCSIIPSHCLKEMENVVKASPDRKIDLIRETIISRMDGKSFKAWYFHRNYLVSHLPLLKFLIGFLSQVANEESTNKMGSPQLAIVFGPCLFWNNSVQIDFKNQNSQIGFKPSGRIEDIGTINNLIKWLIDHHEKIFCWRGRKRFIVSVLFCLNEYYHSSPFNYPPMFIRINDFRVSRPQS